MTSMNPTADRRVLHIGTRASTLARTQTGTVRDALVAGGYPAELHFVQTPGDASQAAQTPVSRIGVGVFTETLRRALADGECDIAVHSFKDLPTAPDPRFIAIVPPRADPREVIVSEGNLSLRELPQGATVGTGAPRRVSQIRQLRPDLQLVDLRGNIDTRMGRVGGSPDDLTAVILARAGLERVGYLARAAGTIPVDDIMPAPAQGALCVEVRADDAEAVAAILPLDDAASHAAAIAEREILATLEAGCSAPVAAYSRFEAGRLTVYGGVFAIDGSRRLIREVSGLVDLSDIGTDPVRPQWRVSARRIGEKLGTELLTAGAAEIMAIDGKL